MKAESHSTSRLLTALLHGPAVEGTVFGGHELRFGDYIVALTPPGRPRMPNGIECLVAAGRADAHVSIGGGRLVVGRVEVTPGPGWNPVPVFDRFACLPPGLEPPNTSLGRSSKAGDEGSGAVVAGYVAGLLLLHGARTRASQVAARALPLLGPAAGTALRHAARGEVPEPIHQILTSRSTSRLISSFPLGIAWLRGLVSAGLPLDLVGARVAPNTRTA